MVNSFEIEKVIFNCGPYNDLKKELIKELDKKKIKYYSCIKRLGVTMPENLHTPKKSLKKLEKNR